MGWSSSLLLALAAQGAGAEASLDLAALGDAAWMCTLPADREQLREHGWGRGARERSHRVDGDSLLVAAWTPAPAGRLLLLPAEDGGEAEPSVLLDLDALTADPAALETVYAQRVGAGLQLACAIPVAAGSRIVHEGAGEQAQALRFLLRSGLALPDGEGLAWRGRLKEGVAQLRDPRNPAAVRTGFKAGTARALPRHPDATDPAGHAPGDFYWSFRGHGVVRFLELEFLDEELPLPLPDLLRALVVRAEVGTSEHTRPGTLLFELPLGDFLGSPLQPGSARAAWCDRSPDGRHFRFRLPIPFRDGLVLKILSPLEEPVGFRLDAGADPILEPGDVPPLTLHAGWVHGVGGEAPLRLQVGGPTRLAGWSFSAVAGAPGGLRFVGPAAPAALLQRAGGGRLLAAPALDGPDFFGRSTITRHYALDAPGSAQGLVFVPGIATGEEVLRWSAVAWYYAPAGTRSSWGPNSGATPGDSVRPWPERRAPAVPAPPFEQVAGALEAERLDVRSMTRGSREEVRLDEAFSALRYLRWQGEAGQQCNLRFPVAAAAEYRVLVRLAQGADFGKVQLQLDGRAAGEPRDCRAEGEAAPGEEIEIARLRLMARPDHVLSLRSVDGGAVGLDYLRLERVAPPPDEPQDEE